MEIQNVILVTIAVWTVALSIALGVLFNFFAKLSKSAGEVNIRKLLDEIIKKENHNEQDIIKLENEINWLKEYGLLSVQKVGLIRFNPFNETGGDHSFSLALLDGKENGIILTGLHTRERTRVYIKEVKAGKAEIELSEEERKALLKAHKG